RAAGTLRRRGLSGASRLAPRPVLPNIGRMTKTTLTDDLHLLVGTLPEALQQALPTLDADGLLEIVMDLGRPAEARFAGRALELSDAPVTRADLDHVVAATGEFSADNRAGLEGTLH